MNVVDRFAISGQEESVTRWRGARRCRRPSDPPVAKWRPCRELSHAT